MVTLNNDVQEIMRVVLQNRLTRRYVLENEGWTPFSREALDFGSCEKAAAFARQKRLTDVQIELEYRPTGQKFHLPLGQPETVIPQPLDSRRPDESLKMSSQENMEEVRRIILEKVCRRLAEQHGLCTKESGNTERFERVLALWIELQRAVNEREKHEQKLNGCTPWNCPDKRVRDAWDALTNPKHLFGLENLFYQLPEGPQMEMAHKALQLCRERQKQK